MIEIIVVSYFSANDLKKLVDSLTGQDLQTWRLTVVDNSDDGAERERITKMLRNDSRLQLSDNRRNVGYFGGARIALQSIDLSTAEIVIVSNADIELSTSQTLTHLLQLRRSLPPDVGILAPRILSSRSGLDQNPHLILRPTVKQQRQRMRRMRNPATAQLAILGSLVKRTLRGRRQNFVVREFMDVYAAHGSFMVFFDEYFRRGGSLDHPTLLFGEELSVAEKSRSIGLRTVYDPSITVRHVEHGQMGFFRSRMVLSEMVNAAKYGFELIACHDLLHSGDRMEDGKYE